MLWYSYKDEKGFSLVELAVVVMLVGFLLAATVSAAASRISGAKIQTTNDRFRMIHESLQHYYDTFGYLPCPANPELGVNNTDFGWGSGTDTGDCTAANVEDDNTNADVVMGMVPTTMLGIIPIMGTDGWNRRFTYIIDKKFTTAAGFIAGNGDITAQSGSTTGRQIRNVVVAVISHGPTGHGAWIAQGSASRIDLYGGSYVTQEEQHENANSSKTDPENLIMPYLNTGVFDDMVMLRQKWQFMGEK